MKTVLLYNSKNKDSLDFANILSQYLYDLGVETMLCKDSYCHSLTDFENAGFSGCDAGIVLGGDGTLLAAARIFAVFSLPFFGINMGRVGFLSSAEKDEAFSALERLVHGNYDIEERLMIKASLIRKEKEVASFIAFNDFVINSGGYSRSINYDLCIENQSGVSYNADGVIIATPTGSTGYSFSAGGPILMDNMNIILITPICPHTFFSRPIVASAKSEIIIICRSNSYVASLFSDGQFRASLQKDERIVVSAADYKAKLIRFGNNDYFKRIITKLYRI